MTTSHPLPRRALLLGLALLVALAVVMVAASLAYLWRAPLISRLEAVGLGMLMGGAVGNAIDRVALGAVTDFFKTLRQ